MPFFYGSIQKNKMNSVLTDESIEAEEGREEKEGQPEIEGSSTQPKGKPPKLPNRYLKHQSRRMKLFPGLGVTAVTPFSSCQRRRR
jgi:hypothetical protein